MPPRAEAVRSIPDTVPADNRTLGWAILEWTAEYLTQPDGPNAGQPWEYTPEQTRIVLRWYAIDERGRLVHRRGVLRRMKGWGKDPFLASLGTVELCGPCRFGGWDADGMPVVVQHPAPWVQVAAVSRDQTRNTMTLLPGLISPAAIDEYRVDIGKEIVYARGVGRIEAVTSSPRSLEGGRATLVIANESHHWLANNEGLAMSDVIRRNLAKSRDGEGRVMEITNAHQPGEGSAAEQTYEAWQKANRKLAGVYYDSLEAPPVKDLTNTAATRRGLLAARGDSHWLDVDRLADEIADPTTPEWMSRRFYLNQVTAVGGFKWLHADEWSACLDPERRQSVPESADDLDRPLLDRVGVLEEGAHVTLAFDGSFSGDVTAIVACTIGNDPFVCVIGAWEAPEDNPMYRVPTLDVEETIRQACRTYAVESVHCDANRWQRSLSLLMDEGLPIVEFPQSASRMVPATKRFTDAVKERLLRQSGDPRLARHIENAVLKIDSRGAQLQKAAEKSPRKIDLAVCAVMAYDRAQEVGQADDEVWGGYF